MTGTAEVCMTQDVEQTVVAILLLAVVLCLVQPVGIDEEWPPLDAVYLLPLILEFGPESDGGIGQHVEEVTIMFTATDDWGIVTGIAEVEIQAVPFAQLSQMQPGEPSEKIRERVIAARKIQEERFKPFKGIHCNAMMTERMLQEFAEPDAASLDMLRMAMERLKLSARAYSRILKVARTIADLEGSEKVQSHHIAEAIGYRNLDRGDWAERGI